MKHKIIIWDEKKYGVFAIYNAIQYYLKNKNNIVFDMEIDKVDNLLTQYSYITIKNKLYTIPCNIVDSDKDENILFAYEGFHYN